MRHQKIAIIGAGTAGLATAALLGRNGHDVTLIERAPKLTSVGAGLLLQPSGMRVMQELELLDAVLAFGDRIDALKGKTRSGRMLMHVAYKDLPNAHTDIHGVGLHRAALCHVLESALRTVPHRAWLGCEVTHLETGRIDQRVHFMQDGDAHCEAFDAVLVANGSASKLQPTALMRYNRQYPWGAMWLIAPLTHELAAFDRPLLQQRFDGSHTMLGILPTGRSPDAPSTRLLSLFWSLPVAEMPTWQDANFDFNAWKARATSVWPELGPLTANIQSQAAFLPATYRDVFMHRWGAGRVGVIGDAAHAMSPQLGQGANMALLDASAMAHAVQASDCWDDVWASFYRQRHGSIRFYQGMSWLLTPFFQSRLVGASWLRDIGFPLLRHLPLMRAQMATTVAGLRQSWFNG